MKKNSVILTTTEIVVPAQMTAAIAGAGLSLVKKVRDGNRGAGKKAQRVAKADELLQAGMIKLMQEVREQMEA